MADGKITIGVDATGVGKSAKSLDQFGRAAKRAGDDGSKAAKGLSSSFSNFGSVLGGVLGAEVIKAGFRGLITSVKSLTTSFAALGDQTAKTADKLGLGVESLQELRFAAERSGVGTQTFDVALQRLTRRAAEVAQGTGVAKDAFEQLGVSVTDSAGNVKESDELFKELAGAFQNVETQSERVRLAFKLFDTEGVALVNVLNQGSEGLDEFSKRARELGFIIGEEAARNSERFVDAQTDLGLAIDGVTNGISQRLLPSLTEFVVNLTNSITKNRTVILSSLQEILESVKDVSSSFGGLTLEDTFNGLVKSVQFLADAFKFTFDFIPKVIAASAVKIVNDVEAIGSVISALFTFDSEIIEKSLEDARNTLNLGVGQILDDIQDDADAQRELRLENERIEAEELAAQREELEAIKNERKLALNEQEVEQERLRKQALEEVRQAEIKSEEEQFKRFIKVRERNGLILAKLDQTLQNERVQNFARASADLARLQQSENQTLKTIGKAGAIAQVTINTAQAASNIYLGFSSIPFVGPTLGLIGAAAAVAFGAEQIGRIVAAQRGGLIQGGVPGRDSVPVLAQQGELIAPPQNFEEVINGVIAQRGFVQRDEAGSSGGASVSVGFNSEEAAQIITIQNNEDRSLGVGLGA